MTDPKKPRLYDKSFEYTRAAETLGRKDRQELVGRQFGALTVTAEANPVNLKRMVSVRCECGTTKTVRANSLLTGNTTSCGCKRQPGSHGHTVNRQATPTYTSWSSMWSRGKGTISPENYKDRGITVCERWSSFEAFLADMGERPEGTTLDRIDNDGPYSPENCRWATKAEQARNRRNVTLHEFAGETLCAKDWADRLGVKPQTLRYWIRAGKSIDQIVTERAS